MLDYYKTKMEVAREFSMGESTVRKWIKKALEGKIDLQLQETEGVYHILKNQHNRNVIYDLIEKNKAHRKLDLSVEVSASQELHKLMGEQKLSILMSSLEAYREIPMKFKYLGRGAHLWNDFYNQRFKNHWPYGISDTFAVATFFEYVLKHYQRYQKFNVIDLGTGNGKPLIPLLKELKHMGRLNSYIGIDISTEMLSIAKTNISPLEIEYRLFERDFETQSLHDVFFEARRGETGRERIPCIAFMLDGTLANHDTPAQIQILNNIRNGMHSDDYLFVVSVDDSDTNRPTFPAFEFKQPHLMAIMIPELLGIKQDMFTKEKIYNEKKDIREVNLILNRDILIHFPENLGSVQLYLGDKINVWKSKKDSFESISEKIKQVGMRLHLIAKYPNEPQVLYMVGLV